MKFGQKEQLDHFQFLAREIKKGKNFPYDEVQFAITELRGLLLNPTALDEQYKNVARSALTTLDPGSLPPQIEPTIMIRDFDPYARVPSEKIKNGKVLRHRGCP